MYCSVFLNCSCNHQKETNTGHYKANKKITQHLYPIQKMNLLMTSSVGNKSIILF